MIFVICFTDDETEVRSLYESYPNVIDEMAFMLDKEKGGVKNWKQLADWFKVPRSSSETFGDSTDDNPAENLLEWLRVKNPRLTVGDLKWHLEELKMTEVLEVIKKSTKGWFLCCLSVLICEQLSLIKKSIYIFYLRDRSLFMERGEEGKKMGGQGYFSGMVSGGDLSFLLKKWGVIFLRFC